MCSLVPDESVQLLHLHAVDDKRHVPSQQAQQQPAPGWEAQQAQQQPAPGWEAQQAQQPNYSPGFEAQLAQGVHPQSHDAWGAVPAQVAPPHQLLQGLQGWVGGSAGEAAQEHLLQDWQVRHEGSFIEACWLQKQVHRASCTVVYSTQERVRCSKLSVD